MFNAKSARNTRRLGVIAAISGESRNLIMRGGLGNGTLTISSSVEEVEPNRYALLNAAEKAFKAKHADGFDFVTNSTDTAFQGKYRRLVLSDNAILGSRTILFEALDAYKQLEHEGRIIFGDESFRLRPDAVEMLTNDRGQNNYRVNWQTLRPQVIGTLLISHAVVVESPFNARYLTELYQIGREKLESNLSRSEQAFLATTQGYDQAQLKARAAAMQADERVFLDALDDDMELL